MKFAINRMKFTVACIKHAFSRKLTVVRSWAFGGAIDTSSFVHSKRPLKEMKLEEK